MPADNTALRALPARAIVGAIADAAQRWSDADFPPRVRATAAIELRLGYTTPVVDYALDRLFEGITPDALEATIADELGGLDALDGVVARPGRPPAFARGIDRVTIVASDTTIGVAIPPLVFALCAKCAVSVKDRDDGLVAAFAATLGEERPQLGAALDVRAWTGGDEAIEAAAIGDAGAVVAFGDDEALRALRARCNPDATFIPFGRRASAGYVTQAALLGNRDALARNAARDALLYDGDGCLSLHVLFVERAADGAHEPFVDALAAACAAIAIEFPPGTRAPGRAARANQYAAAATLRAANGGGRTVRAPDGAWCVAVDPGDDVPPLGGGVIPVVFVDGLDAAAAYVARHHLPLQAVGAAVPDVAFAERLGAVRVAELGRLQAPPFAGRHGGRPRIAEFVRWIDGA